MKWIDVNDRLPECEVRVLVVDVADNIIDVDYRCNDDRDPQGVWGESYFITHWMPLPDPPASSNSEYIPPAGKSCRTCSHTTEASDKNSCICCIGYNNWEPA